MKNKVIKLIVCLCALPALLLSSQWALAQQAKGKKGAFALENATIVTVTKGTVTGGTLLVQDGKIAALGTNVTLPQGVERIDCSGLTIYPGMIDGGTRLGLMEVGSDPRTRDFNEIGDVIPHMQALTAVNPNSALIPVNRVNGVTTSLAVPQGGLFPGTAALINLHGYTPEQMAAGFQAVVLNFPSTGRRGRFDSRKEEDIKKESEKALKTLNEVWKKAVRYQKVDSTIEATGKSQQLDYYPELEVLKPVARGEAPLLLEVNRAKDIEAALKWVEENQVKAVFTGVAEGWRVADKLAAAKIPVVTGPVLGLPTRDYDKYDRAYANAGLMLKAGVKVAIRTADAENVRNLPYHAGFAATYGMGQEEALKAVTIVPAEIFGVASRLGSLEVGKEATLFVTDGDPFETKTQVKHLFIQGWLIPLESRHTKLYEEFLKRDPGLQK